MNRKEVWAVVPMSLHKTELNINGNYESVRPVYDGDQPDREEASFLTLFRCYAVDSTNSDKQQNGRL